uniref:Uncharacterized protein n=1 Tax=Arundo donax TaxID=35708 RepID=A0A0A9AE66_ARUDO
MKPFLMIEQIEINQFCLRQHMYLYCFEIKIHQSMLLFQFISTFMAPKYFQKI